MPMIQAVVFDMDGLLVDSEDYWFQAREKVAASVGKKWTAEDARAMMGVNTREWVSYMIQRLDLDLCPDQVQEAVIDYFVNLYRVRVPFLPGAVAAVHLAAEHFPTALATGSHRRLYECVVNDPQIRGCLNLIVGGDEVPAGKPAPDIYLETARRLGMAPAQCVCIEDSGNGIRAGHAAGMHVISVPSRHLPPTAEELALTDRVIGSLEAFTLTMLEEIK